MIDSREPVDLDNLIERSLGSEGLAPVPPGLTDRICMARLRESETRRVRMSISIAAIVALCSVVFVAVSLRSVVVYGWIDRVAPGCRGLLDSWVSLAPGQLGDILVLAFVPIVVGLAVASLSLLHISSAVNGVRHARHFLRP